MADRIEREIEELLAKLETELPPDGRKPISLEERRRKRQAPRRPSAPRLPSLQLNPPTLLLAGAGIMIAGLFLSMFWQPLIWLSFAGVLIFITAFLLSFRSRPPVTPGRPRGVYWRDRYIEYEPPRSSRFRNPFRRR